MTGLDSWLEQATRCLSREAAAQVRREIQEHYEAARQTAGSGGADEEEADRRALAALGNAKAANAQYRKVLLTSAEMRMLREGNWEARAICSRGWVKSLLVAVPGAALCIGLALFFRGGSPGVLRAALAFALGTGLLYAGLFLPVHTPARGRVFRLAKWLVITAIAVLVFGPDAYKYSWLLIASAWPMVWTERTRASIRRKLPVSQWPRQLYL